MEKSNKGNIFTYAQQKRHQSTGRLFAPFGRLDDVIQKVMATLDLVPVEEVRLRKFKLLNVVRLHERNTNAIQRRKQPTASRTLLIRYRFAFRFNLGR